jgi:hypothetical protein
VSEAAVSANGWPRPGRAAKGGACRSIRPEPRPPLAQSWVSPALVVSAGGVVAGSMVGRCRLRPRGWRTCGMRAVRFDLLGFDAATQGDQLLRQLVLARIIEPSSKLDAARVLEEIGIQPCPYPTLKRR